MKIQRVKIEEFKAIKHLDEEIAGQNIILLGDNGVGKSSFIQFIQLALGKQTDMPECDAEGLVVANKDGQNWTFKVATKKGKPVIEITSPDGFKDARKSALASVVGAMEFDIDEFVKLSETTAGRKKQVEIYKSFLPQETQQAISEQEFRVKKSYDERTELNREAKLLEGYISEHPFKKVIDMPKAPVDITELGQKIEAAIRLNEKIKDVKMRQSQRKEALLKLNQDIANTKKQIADLEEVGKTAQDWIDQNPETDITDLLKQKDAAVEVNSTFELKADFDKKQAHLSKVIDEAGELTAFIGSSNEVISDAIKDSDVPVEGLTFDYEKLIYNGVPVSIGDLSTSEIMHLGCKLKMAENPELGILFIQRGESLGAARLKEIQEMAEASGWQIIMEQVERGNEKLTIELMGA